MRKSDNRGRLEWRQSDPGTEERYPPRVPGKGAREFLTVNCFRNNQEIKGQQTHGKRNKKRGCGEKAIIDRQWRRIGLSVPESLRKTRHEHEQNIHSFANCKTRDARCQGHKVTHAESPGQPKLSMPTERSVRIHQHYELSVSQSFIRGTSLLLHGGRSGARPMTCYTSN